MSLHLVKLCVGMQCVEDLIHAQKRFIADQRALGRRENPYHITRATPKHGTELLEDGSLYWVIKNKISARQRLIAIEAIADMEGKRACKLVLDTKLIRTIPTPKRPFQGWRYLCGEDAPADLDNKDKGSTLDEQLEQKLKDQGVW